MQSGNLQLVLCAEGVAAGVCAVASRAAANADFVSGAAIVLCVVFAGFNVAYNAVDFILVFHFSYFLSLFITVSALLLFAV